MKSLSELQRENELLRQLATNVGFYNYYFEMLKQSKTYTEAFEKANLKHYDLFGEYKYSSYNSFKNVISRNNKNKNK